MLHGALMLPLRRTCATWRTNAAVTAYLLHGALMLPLPPTCATWRANAAVTAYLFLYRNRNKYFTLNLCILSEQFWSNGV